MTRKAFGQFFASLLIIMGLGRVVAADSVPKWQEVEQQWGTTAQLPIQDLQQRGEAGDVTAKYFYYWRTVREQPKDAARWQRAEQWLKEASAAGLPHAVYEESTDYRSEEPEKYYAFLQRAAEAGLPMAQLRLGEEHLEGQRAPVDEAKAVYLIQQAVDNGHLQALALLAELYASGLGEPRHPKETPFELYLHAAWHDDEDAMIRVAERYRFGYGTGQDLMESARWYWRAREHGQHESFPLLAPNLEPLELRNPEEKLFARLYSLYAKAQTRRDPEVMRKVGQAFLKGEYGAQNSQTGYFWLSFAARRGDKEARELLPQSEAKMTKEEVTKIRQEVDQMIAGRETRGEHYYGAD